MSRHGRTYRRGPSPTWSGDERTYAHGRTFRGELVGAQDARGARMSPAPAVSPRVPLPKDADLERWTAIRQQRFQL